MTSKVLRVALLQREKLVQTKLVPMGEAVTIGPGAHHTLVVSASLMPAPRRIFSARRGSYRLHTDGLGGRVKWGDVLLRLPSDLPEQQLCLGPEDKGKLVLCEGVAVLFQFVDAPPPTLRPLQAMDFRPSLVDEDDPVFLGFLAVCSALAVVCMIWVAGAEPREFELDEIPKQFTKIVMPRTPPKAEVKTDPPPTELATPPLSAREPAQVVASPRAETAVGRAKHKAALRKKMRGLISPILIGTGGPTEGGRLATVWSQDDVGLLDIDQALQERGAGLGVSVARIRAGAGVGAQAVQIGEVAAFGGGEGGGLGAVEAPRLALEVGQETPEVQTTTGDRGAIKRRVQHLTGQLIYCYETRLKLVPDLSGRVDISWTLDAGRVSDVYVADNRTHDAPLADCMVRKIERWRFSRELEGEISWPFVFRKKR